MSDKDIEEYSIEHYLLEYPEDELLDNRALLDRYNKWVNELIQERYADSILDSWLSRGE